MNRASYPLQIELGPSRMLAGCLFALYGTALGIVVSSRLPEFIIGIAVIVLLFMGWRDVSKISPTQSKQRIRRLVLRAQRDWIIVSSAGVPIRGRPLDGQLVHPWAVAFTLADKNGKRTPVLVLPDMTSGQSYHALRLWLRQNSQSGIDGAPS